MKILVLAAASIALLLASPVIAADPAHARSHARIPVKQGGKIAHTKRRARVYDATNFPTRSYSRKASSFVPRQARTAVRAGHATSTSSPRAASASLPHPHAAKPRADMGSPMRARDEFRQDHPCPSTGWTTGACPGFTVDHIKPLKEGGADSLANLQWRPTAATP
jgi:hypothetical protein